MTLLIDDTLTTAIVATPFREEWVTTDVPIAVREGLTAPDVTVEDVALLPAAEATLLGETHVLLTEIAIVLDGTGPIVMRTPARPDDVDNVIVRLLDTGPTAEMLVRALLRPYFGITASGFVLAGQDPGAADAQAVVLDGAAGLAQPEFGFQSDLVRDWFVLTGQAVVSHVLVAGVRAFARGLDPELAALREAVRLGQERKREVRGIVAARWEVTDRGALATMTNRQRFELTQADRNSLANMATRGSWGSRFGSRLPTYADTLPDEGGHAESDVKS